MKQQKKFAKSRNIIKKTVGGDAHIDPNFEGITLISLVITIVVMLILAGVAISITVGDGSVTQHAQNATEQWNAKVDEEQLKIDEALGYLPGGTPSDLPEGWDSSKVADVIEEESTNRKAPIPVGYTASQISTEDEISEGLVIYQTETAVTGEPDSDAHITAMEEINQYVWIPVDDINDMVMCKYNNKTTKIDGTATEDGKKICELVYDVANNKITCTVHGYDTTITLSDDSTSTNFIDKVGLAGRVQNVSKTNTETTADNKTIYTYTQTPDASQTFSANSGYREPDLVTSKDVDDVTTDDNTSNDYMAIAGVVSATALKHQLNDKFIEMAKSVAKYGGFYISRFEPGYDNDKVISKKNQKVLIAMDGSYVNFLAGDKWYGLYNKTLNSVEKGESVNSHMIWGCQYDQVIEFLGDKAEVGHLYQTTKQEKTGYDYETNGTKYVDQDILNNIYDLEGNNSEWTAQAYNTDSRVGRGSYYNIAYSIDFSPASFRNSSNPTNTIDFCTTRPTLYVK